MLHQKRWHQLLKEKMYIGYVPVGVGGEVEGVGHAMLGVTAGVEVGVSKENGGVWGRRVLSLS